MDPNATLTEIRAILDSESPDVDRLAELFLALDNWMSNGGFLPVGWRR